MFFLYPQFLKGTIMKKSTLLLTIVSIISGCQAAALVKNKKKETMANQPAKQQPANQKIVTIYTMSTCFYCQKAKHILDENNIPYTSIDIFSRQGLLEELEKKSGSANVPQIYVNDQFFGGYKDLLFADIFGDVKEKLLG